MNKYLLSSIVFCTVTLPALMTGAVMRLFQRRPLQSWRSLGHVRTILVVRFDGVGDVLLTTGFAADLKRVFAGARILVVVDAKFAEFVRLLDVFDEVIGLDYNARTLKNTLLAVPRLFSFCRANLWGCNIDLAINPRWDRDLREFGVVGYLSMCRSFVGYEMFRHNDKHLRNFGCQWFYSDLVPDNGIVDHEISRHRDVIAYLGGEPSAEIPAIPPQPADMEWARAQLAATGRVHPLVVLGIGSSTLRRTWPAQRFLQVAQALEGFDFLVVGNDADGRLSEEVLRPGLHDKLLNYGGKCSLSQSAALVSHAVLCIGNSSSTMHLAACADVPVLEICGLPTGGNRFHDQSPSRFTPQYTNHIVVTPSWPADPACANGCIANDVHCIANISVAEVVAAAKWLLQKSATAEYRDWYPLTVWQELPVLEQQTSGAS